MRILVVEDDMLQLPVIRQLLRMRFVDADIRTLKSECEFRHWIEALRPQDKDEIPDIILMDIMLTWCQKRPQCQKPVELIGSDMYHAGIRCRETLSRLPHTLDIPVIYYSVLTTADLPAEVTGAPNTYFVSKSSSPLPLYEAITNTKSIVAG